MNRTVDNEEAIAYGLFMAIVFIVAAAVVIACFSPVLDGLVDYTNTQIDDGDMSMQTKAAFEWNVNAALWIPVFALIGILLWAVVRPLEQKRLGG